MSGCLPARDSADHPDVRLQVQLSGRSLRSGGMPWASARVMVDRRGVAAGEVWPAWRAMTGDAAHEGAADAEDVDVHTGC